MKDTHEEVKQIEHKEEKEVQDNGDVNLELAESERQQILDIQSKTLEENEQLKQRVAALEAKQEEEPEEDTKELSEVELDKMYAELMAEINREKAEEQEEEKDDDQAELDRLYNELISNIDDEEETVKVIDEEEPEEEVVEEPEIEEEVEEVEEEPVVEDNSKYEELEKQIEALKQQVEMKQQENNDLIKQLSEKPAVVENAPVELGSMEELLAQKQQLEERLKETSRELKQNKKEYVPLARIKKTLAKDEAKLRRREAIVAKKKIMLFGVTNYVVDEEKEQELSQDLDQLEALRLSVQHCEEVMTENKDRYPLLESANKILKKTVEDLKSDIAVIDQKIEELKSKNGDNDDNND